jgi:hypothetical protein
MAKNKQPKNDKKDKKVKQDKKKPTVNAPVSSIILPPQ